MSRAKKPATILQQKTDVAVKETTTPETTVETTPTVDTGKVDETAATKQADESPIVDTEDHGDQPEPIIQAEKEPDELTEEEEAALQRLQEENLAMVASRKLGPDEIYRNGIQSQVDAYVGTFTSAASDEKRIARQTAFMQMVERLVYVDDANHLFIGMDVLVENLRKHREGLMSDAQLYAHANMVSLPRASIARYQFIMTVLDTVVRVLLGKTTSSGALDLTKFSEQIVNTNGKQYAERFQLYYQRKVGIEG